MYDGKQAYESLMNVGARALDIGKQGLALGGLAALLMNPLACGGGSSGGAGGNGQASLSASTSNVSNSGNRTTYDLEINENGGVGVTLEKRTACFKYPEPGECNDRYDAVDKFGTNRVEAGSSITARGKSVASAIHPNTFTETWYGTDDNGNAVQTNTYTVDLP